ncbi:methyltransferase domain-containing protein [Streptomyces spongiicola]|uniref:Methyltransferase domain-containing protein n=1 Tax=Streptomyces spongiicola TaxID=1690221 RepID=A0A388T263_9ACTN|nr:class I SAM-dependent methyltransferase [Streptomyces spongiicola]GBQ02354.1 methyltransferase domain-containing protein [Streptomyces spongiicola]
MSTGWLDDDTALFVRYGDAFVPRRREQLDIVCDLLGELPRPVVLELGCGDGRLTERLLGRLPEVRVTAVDASARMLRLARIRLAGFAERVALRRVGMEEDGALCRVGTEEGGALCRVGGEEDGAPGGGPYGAVVTSLAVHHLDDRAKQALYRRVRAALAPGGAFVMADLVSPVGPAPLALAAARWDAEVAAADPAATLPFESARWNTFRFPDPVDRPSGVGEHLTWLARAGFADADVCWLYAGHAVFHARRPGRSEETA